MILLKSLTPVRRYYQQLLSNSTNRPQILQEALAFCEEIKSIGGFAKIREIMSSDETLKEPEWRGRECLRAFNEQKVFEERLSKLLTDDDKSKILFEKK